MKNKLGSNQYKERTKYRFGVSVVILGLLCLLVAFWGYYSKPQTMISPLPRSFMPVIVKTVVASPGDPIVDEISRVFKNEGTKTVAKAIMCFYSESKLNTLAYNFNSNGTADAGIAQINDVWGMSIEDRQDYRKNIRKAYEIYKKHGWTPWYGSGCH